MSCLYYVICYYLCKLKIKARWACLPLDFRFYMMKKDIEEKSATAKRKGKVIPFESKMAQAATMIKDIQNYYGKPVLVVTESWLGNDGLWSRLDRGSDESFHLLSRMRKNIVLYDFVPVHTGPPKAGRLQKNLSSKTCYAWLHSKVLNKFSGNFS